MTNPMNYNFDDNFNVDLPAEIEDLHDENCEWEPVELPNETDDLPCGYFQDSWDWSDDNEDFEDDSWNDADSLASAGWGTDEDYGLFDDGGEW